MKRGREPLCLMSVAAHPTSPRSHHARRVLAVGPALTFLALVPVDLRQRAVGVGALRRRRRCRRRLGGCGHPRPRHLRILNNRRRRRQLRRRRRRHPSLCQRLALLRWSSPGISDSRPRRRRRQRRRRCWRRRSRHAPAVDLLPDRQPFVGVRRRRQRRRLPQRSARHQRGLAPLRRSRRRRGRRRRRPARPGRRAQATSKGTFTPRSATSAPRSASRRTYR